MPRPLCVLLPEIGVVSETFIRWDVHTLLPGGTVVIADPPPAGESLRHGAAWGTGDCPTLAFESLPGAPPPPPDRVSAVAGFLFPLDYPCNEMPAIVTGAILGLQCILALDRFTEDNGATRPVPGSHRPRSGLVAGRPPVHHRAPRKPTSRPCTGPPTAQLRAFRHWPSPPRRRTVPLVASSVSTPVP